MHQSERWERGDAYQKAALLSFHRPPAAYTKILAIEFGRVLTAPPVALIMNPNMRRADDEAGKNEPRQRLEPDTKPRIEPICDLDDQSLRFSR